MGTRTVRAVIHVYIPREILAPIQQLALDHNATITYIATRALSLYLRAAAAATDGSLP